MREGREHKHLAILYRTNAQSRALEDALIMAGFPYVIHGGISFYERKEVKDIVAYLRLAINPHDDASFQRVINVPSRFLGKVFMEKIKAFKGSHWDASPDKLVLKGYEKDGYGKFRDIIEKLMAEVKGGESTPSDLIDLILSDDGAGYEKYILGEDEEEESSRMENIATLKFVVNRYEKVEDFLDYIETMTSKAKHSINGVQLMTVHKSKGLEFPVCYVVGVNDGILPHFKSIEDTESGAKPFAIEEERRLLYVAITRAEAECHISSTASFNGRPNPTSRFIKELGMTLSIKAKEKEEVIEEVFNHTVLGHIEHEQKIMMRDIMED